MRGRIRLVVALLLTLPSCGGSSTAPPDALNLSGSWTGLVGQPMSGGALRLTWQVSQANLSLTGSASLVKPAAGAPANGTITGTVNGDRLTLAFSAPAGSVQGFPSCAVSGSGSATVTGTTMAGTLDLTFASCNGTGLEPTGSNQLSLSKQ